MSVHEFPSYPPHHRRCRHSVRPPFQYYDSYYLTRIINVGFAFCLPHNNLLTYHGPCRSVGPHSLWGLREEEAKPSYKSALTFLVSQKDVVLRHIIHNGRTDSTKDQRTSPHLTKWQWPQR